MKSPLNPHEIPIFDVENSSAKSKNRTFFTHAAGFGGVAGAMVHGQALSPCGDPVFLWWFDGKTKGKPWEKPRNMRFYMVLHHISRQTYDRIYNLW